MTPNIGSLFGGWDGDPDCTDGVVTMDNDRACIATLTSSGDLDHSGRTDGFDLGAIGLAFGSQPGDANWNPDADLDGNGIVESADLAIIESDFGKTSEGGP